MPNFAVKVNESGLEKANRIMELYEQSGDKKEDTLLRIFEVAEKNHIRGTHPELEGSLNSIDSIIGSLVKAINGLVAGQDNTINQLTEQLERAIGEKRSAVEAANKKMEEARTIRDEATAAKEKAENEIKAAKEQATEQISRANQEREQAIRERDAAQTIRNMLEQKEQNMEDDFNRRMDVAKAQEDLKIKTAVMEKERELGNEFQEKIREYDKQNARLTLRIEQLMDRLKELEGKASDVSEITGIHFETAEKKAHGNALGESSSGRTADGSTQEEGEE